VETKFPQVKLLKNQENLGFTKGNNVGIKASTGKYVFLLNSDIKVFEGCIDALADFLDQNPGVGWVAPRVLNRDLTLQCTCRKDPTLWNTFCADTGLAKLFRNSDFFSGEQMFFFKGEKTTDREVLMGCFSALRRQAIEEVGLMDEGFYMYGDELDWCRRFRQGGWRVVYHPSGQAIHYGGTSTVKKDPVRFAVLQQHSELRYWQKYHGWGGRIGIRCLMIFRHFRRWIAGLVSSLLKPAGREEGRVRMRVSIACLRDLFGAGSKQEGKT